MTIPQVNVSAYREFMLALWISLDREAVLM